MSTGTNTFLEIQKRLKYLIGEDGSTGADSTTTGAAQKSHINGAVRDIINQFPFSWNVASDTLTLSAGTANLPTDFNPKWGIEDARIENSSTNDDNVFMYVPIPDRDQPSDKYLYWITYDTTSDVYVFNSNQSSGSVKIYYHFTPDDMSLDADVCQVPDREAVAYLAASKHWISDERNSELSQKFETEAQRRIQALYIQDLNFGPQYGQGTPVEYEGGLTQIHADDLQIERP